MKLSNWIGVGLGYKNILHDKAYKFDYNSEEGHGSYLLSSNGYSWSHSHKAENI